MPYDLSQNPTTYCQQGSPSASDITNRFLEVLTAFWNANLPHEVDQLKGSYQTANTAFAKYQTDMAQEFDNEVNLPHA